MIAIVTDTTCDLPPELVQQYQVEVVPLYVHFGERVFRPGVDLSNAGFLERLKSSSAFPTTEPPSVSDFVAVYERLLGQHSHIISIHLSGRLSQTYDNALAARAMLGASNIYVVDSRTVSGGVGLIVWAAARQARQGRPVEAILDYMEAMRAQHRFYLVVDTIEYMHKGGRIGGAKAWVGMLLGLKPILTLYDGQVEPVRTVPSRSQALARLRSMVTSNLIGCTGVHMAIFHVAADEEARQLADELAEAIQPAHLLFCEAGPVIATHSGPGALAVAFYSEG